MTNIKDNTPQTLLSLGNESFAKYHITGNERIDNEIMVKSTLNKISIAQHRGFE